MGKFWKAENLRGPPLPLPLPPVCAFNTSPCVRSKRPRVHRHHAHMFQHMCAWCRHTRGRFECTHGDVLNARTEVFSVPHHNKHHTTHNHTHQHAHTNTHTTRTQHAHNTSRTHNEPRHQTTPHTAPTHGTHTSHTTHHDTSRTPHTTPQPAHTTHEHAPSTHTRTTTQQVQTLNCLFSCPPSGNLFDNSAPHLSFVKNK